MVDDRGCDYTTELMSFYCDISANIKYFKRPKDLVKGVGSCRNYGYEQSQGEFIMWLDDDDLLDCNKLEKQMELASPDNNYLITCAWGRLVEKRRDLKDLSIYRDYDDPVKLLLDYAKLEYFPSHVFLVPRPLIEKTGLWNTNLKINEDGVFFTRIIINASKIKFAPDTFVLYRGQTNNNISKLDSVEKAYHLIESWNIIESLIPVDRRKEVAIFLYNIRRYVYTLLKQSGYRKVIIRNGFQFRDYILEDINRKFRERFQITNSH